MIDRAQQALHLLALKPIAETTSDPNSYGFRERRSCHDALEQCFNALARKTSAQYILEGDIKSCFDKIHHHWLLENILMDKVVLKRWLKAGYVEDKILFPTTAGTPQGGIASPCLANITLDGMEAAIKQAVPPESKVNYIRYADDFIVTGNSPEILELTVKPVIEKYLLERGLELSKEKTKITHIEDGFNFLGQNIRKYNGKLLIKPSKESIKSIRRKIRDIVRSNRGKAAHVLIGRLNPVIRGWSNYHRHCVAKSTFSSLSHYTFHCVWKWSKREHSNKGTKWIYDKYFSQGSTKWMFSAKVPNRKEKRIWLYNPAKIPIKRHIKVKSIANPYDPQFDEYFLKRYRKTIPRQRRGMEGRFNTVTA